MTILELNFRGNIGPMKVKNSFLDRSFVFEGLDPELVNTLRFVATVHTVDQGEVLFRAGDDSTGFYSVVDGLLKISVTSDDGQERLIAIIGPDDIVGEMGVVDGLPRSADVTALRASELAHIRKADFEAIAQANPSLYQHILRALSGRLRQANDAGAARSMLPLEGRLAKALLSLADSFGNDLPDGRTVIRYKITQADIGNMCGAARENVNRQLGEWRRDGLVSKISGYYCLHDKRALGRMAYI